MQKLIGCLISLVFVFGSGVKTLAFPQFQKQFLVKYVINSDDPAWQALVKKAKCNICHDPKKGPDGKASKKNRNAYGKQLAKLLSKKDKKDPQKIQAALDKVADLKANPSDSNGPTYGQLIAERVLPVQ